MRVFKLKNLSKGWRMYLSILSLFLFYAVVFILFQHRREKKYRISLLDTMLQEYNMAMSYNIEDFNHSDIQSYVLAGQHPNLRVTVISKNGRVLFDNVRTDYAELPDHSDRKEVIDAIQYGKGYVIDRHSVSTNVDYFYSATYIKDREIIIRSALPYDVNLYEIMKVDQHFIWFSLVVIFILSLIMRVYVSVLDSNFNRDKEEARTKTRRQLTQNISHELKTPVASIQGYLETMLANPNMDKETTERFLDRSLIQTKRLGSLLQDLSTLNKMWDAPSSWSFECVDLSKLTFGIAEDVALQLKEKEMTFHNELQYGVMVKGNPSLIYSIFRNLTDNAIAYSGMGCKITVSARQEGRDWVIVFSDNGVGVGQEHLNHLFERFYRVDGGRSRKTGGTGLGLAIVKNAVQIHGGQISAENSNGLKFTIRLPKWVS